MQHLNGYSHNIEECHWKFENGSALSAFRARGPAALAPHMTPEAGTVGYHSHFQLETPQYYGCVYGGDAWGLGN